MTSSIVNGSPASADSLDITGSNFDDTITGGDASRDTLVPDASSAGDDTIDGGAGTDTLTGGDSASTRSMAATATTSLVVDGDAVAGGADGRHRRRDRRRRLPVTGSDFADTITGRQAKPHDYDRAGDDTIVGFVGGRHGRWRRRTPTRSR